MMELVSYVLSNKAPISGFERFFSDREGNELKLGFEIKNECLPINQKNAVDWNNFKSAHIPLLNDNCIGWVTDDIVQRYEEDKDSK